jgi:hypothetical protein
MLYFIGLPTPSQMRYGDGCGSAGIILAMKTKPAIRRKRSARLKKNVPPIEVYTDKRVAEFLLNNSVDAEDYARACADVRKLGLDPAKIEHWKPPGVK